jgi:type VI secretion system protein ImpC
MANRTPARVDRDNLDEVLARFGSGLDIPVRGGGESDYHVSLRFTELEDFHPDGLYDRLPLFRSLSETRSHLADPSAFASAARESEAGPSSVGPTEPGRSPVDLLERVVEETAGASPEGSAVVGDDLRAFVRRAVGPHLVREATPKQEQLLSAFDAAISAGMRSLLHHPDVQSLEALWRGVHFLTRRIETGTQLQLCLIDISKAELAADLAPDQDLETSGLYRLLVESSIGTPGSQPWALLAGAYSFGPDPEDIGLLARIAAVARQAGAPWLSAADPLLVGCESLHATPDPDDWKKDVDAGWEALRRRPEATSLGLALPRFLLRLPYGRDTDPCERFDFEEMEECPAHERYLWGSPTFACVALLAESFAASGWALRPGMHRDIGGLPLHVFKVAGETRLTPCAEALLTERAAERLMGRGLMALASIKDSDAVRLVRFQSVADPPAPVAGPWQPRVGR